MISKELLEKVLDFTSGNVFIKEIETRNNDIEYLCNVGGWNLLNIYELAHMCKEWANKYVTNIGSGYDKDKEIYWCICNNGEFQFYENTELEAVIKACEWILKQQSGCSE